ncbi:hypothetical protein [Micromonospora sp. LOL_023]|uniref:hypothetical protein n=1 Tax=Micromonospora sp. LOL_023 TaxID=3345418 RepID=UPI003A8C1F38
MSEYQYYEFLAIDRPLDGKQMDELREMSTRAEITHTSFTNTYDWGDFKGDPLAMVEEYFDAHLYLANWGTRQLVLRLPLQLLDLETAQQYCWAEPAEAYQADEHLILNFSSEEEDEDFEHSGEGLLGPMVSIREHLAAGDHRALYLAWLLQIQGGEFGDEATEPPVPAGLADLTGALQGFVDFLRIDPHLVAAAAQASPPIGSGSGPDADDPAALAAWVAALPAADKDATLIRLLTGDARTATAELRQRFRADTGTAAADAAAGRPRTIGELLDAAETIREQTE